MVAHIIVASSGYTSCLSTYGACGVMASRLLGITVILFSVACTGCSPFYRVGSVVVGIAGEDRTPLDRVVGWVTGQDCSAIRANKGGHWCQPVYENRPYSQQLYCYRTLAREDCFQSPSPYPYDHLVGSISQEQQRTW